jgi:hypothetical protein
MDSVFLSTLLVASSSKIISLSSATNNHLANANLCFSHQLKLTHLSLISVLNQFGNLLSTISKQANFAYFNKVSSSSFIQKPILNHIVFSKISGS